MKQSRFALILLLSLGCAGGGGGGSALDGPSPTAVGENPSEFTFTPSIQNFLINWDQFPEFNLADGQTSVYMGPHMGDGTLKPLKHGFSHMYIGSTTQEGRNNTPVSKRAILWTSVAGAAGTIVVGDQPWGNISSPWNNDMSKYLLYWDNIYLKPYASMYADTVGQPVPNVDLLISDMERVYFADSDILGIKFNPMVPSAMQQLTNSVFIDVYKRSMAALYNTSHDHARQLGFQGKMGSYGEPHIRRTWWGIPNHTWQEWITNPSQDLKNFLLGDFNSSDPNWHQHDGPFYDNYDNVNPSAYYFYKYPVTKAANPAVWMSCGDYLAYLLFQIEANKAYTSKPIIVWEYLRFHDSSVNAGEFISPEMAMASAVFPYMAGAGIWLYDYYPGTYGAGDTDKNYSAYEYFTYGLYQIAKYKTMFEGTHTFYMPTNPRDLMVNNQPVWRGVVKGNQILVAACNPYAEPQDSTTIALDYQGTSFGSITLSGQETKLELFQLP